MDEPKKIGRTGRVLVLGDDTRSFLSTVRSLGRSGLEVHVAWCPLNAPSAKSKYIRQIHRIAPYRSDDTSWLMELNSLVSQYQFDQIIPCHDSSILPLQTHKAELQDLERYCLVEERAFEICFSKEKTFELARTLGVRLPRQLLVYSEPELKKAAEVFGLPLVVKPYASANLVDPNSKQHVRKIRNSSEMHAFLVEANLAKGFLAQENFIGKGIGVEVLCNDGEILCAFQHERVHEPLMGGGSSYRKSVPLHSELLNATRKLMQALHYTGVAMAEYKVNAKGDWILIEINARFWGSLPLTLAAGMDFPRAQYEMICEGRREFPQTYQYNLFTRNWLSDFYWLKANLKADRRDPTLHTLPLGNVAAEMFNVLTLRETSDTFVLDDPRPAWDEITGFIGTRVKQKLNRLPLLRRRHSKQAKTAVEQAKNVLFICKGNICRSPFAEAVLRKQGFDCASAGYFPKANRSSPDDAIEAAKRLGFDMTAHRSKVVDSALMKWADVVFVFDSENVEELEGRWPEEMAKVKYLGALDPTESLSIADPYGCSVEEFMKTYTRVQKAISLGFAQRNVSQNQ